MFNLLNIKFMTKKCSRVSMRRLSKLFIIKRILGPFIAYLDLSKLYKFNLENEVICFNLEIPTINS